MSKTAHQLARQLLTLPDVPVWVYELDKHGTPVGIAPSAVFLEGFTLDGDDHQAVEIYGRASVHQGGVGVKKRAK